MAADAGEPCAREKLLVKGRRAELQRSGVAFDLLRGGQDLEVGETAGLAHEGRQPSGEIGLLEVVQDIAGLTEGFVESSLGCGQAVVVFGPLLVVHVVRAQE